MREHNALREARGSRGVLHVAHIVLVNCGAALLHLRKRHGLAELYGVVPCKAARLTAVNGDDILKIRQSLALQLTRLAGRKLGTQLTDGSDIVAILEAVDHDKRVGVGLAQQILDLMNLVCGVDRDQNCADLRRSPEGDVPCGHICRPDGHVVALLHIHCDQGSRKIVHVIAELGVRSRVVELRVAECILRREHLADAVKNIREGVVDQPLLRPDIVARAAVVRLQRVLVLRLVGAHIVRILREHNPCVRQLRRPALHPLKRYIAGVMHAL